MIRSDLAAIALNNPASVVQRRVKLTATTPGPVTPIWRLSVPGEFVWELQTMGGAYTTVGDPITVIQLAVSDNDQQNVFNVPLQINDPGGVGISGAFTLAQGLVFGQSGDPANFIDTDLCGPLPTGVALFPGMTMVVGIASGFGGTTLAGVFAVINEINTGTVAAEWTAEHDRSLSDVVSDAVFEAAIIGRR